MHKSRLPITLKRKKAGREDLNINNSNLPGGHRPRLSCNSNGDDVVSLGSKHDILRKPEDDPPYKMYTLDSERLRAIEALSDEPSLPPQPPTIHIPTSLRRLILSDDEDEDVRILMERTEELLRSSKKKKKKKDSSSTPLFQQKELVQSSCESDQGIGSMPSSIISVSGHGNPLPEEKEEDEDSVSTVETRSRKKGLATKRSELLQEKPIIPNIHVGSKLKAMLEENKMNSGGSGNSSSAVGTKKRFPKKTGKWDTIMKNINDNQKATEKRTYKEVKSKVFGDHTGSFSRRAKASKSGSNAKISSNNNSGRSSSRTSLVSTGRTGESNQSESSHRDKANDTVRRYANSSGLESHKKSSISSPSSPPAPKLSARKSKDRRYPPNSTANSNNVIGASPNGVGQHSSNQPDLVKSSTTRLGDNEKYSGRLEEELDAKNRQVDELRRRLINANKGFDVMTLLYNRTLSKVHHPSSRNKGLETQISSLKKKLSLKDQEIDDLKKEESKLKEELESGLSKYKNDKTGVTEDFNRRLSQIKTQHATLLEKVERNYRDDLEELKANHSRVLLETQEAAEAKLQHVLEENENKWKGRILQELSEKEESLRTLENNSASKEKEWESQKLGFVQRINDLIHQIESQRTQPLSPIIPDKTNNDNNNSNINNTHNHPTYFTSTPKLKSKNPDDSVIFNLNAEVESLKAVVDMRTADVHQLRKDNVALEEKLAEFDKMKCEHAKTLAQLEDLRAQIESKSVLERKLSEENRYLQSSVERELVEKKRLSMENEELLWKIHKEQSTSGDMHNNNNNNQSMSFIEGVSSRNVLFDYDEDEAAKLSYSFTEGVSASPFKTKSRLSRSMSLKERKMGVVMNGARHSAHRTSSIDIMSTSLPPPRHGKSAFVREVIDKGDSVSWKIEYEDKNVHPILPFSPGPKQRPNSGLSIALSCPPSVCLTRRKVGLNSSSFLFNEPLSESSSESSVDGGVKGGGGGPLSVDIVEDSDDVILNADDISSSSEIEIDEKSPPEEEKTLRPECMATSLPSYDLHMLFSNQSSSSSCKESGGESLMTLEEETTTTTTTTTTKESGTTEDEEFKTERTMTDSLSAVSWSDDFEE